MQDGDADAPWRPDWSGPEPSADEPAERAAGAPVGSTDGPASSDTTPAAPPSPWAPAGGAASAGSALLAPGDDVVPHAGAATMAGAQRRPLVDEAPRWRPHDDHDVADVADASAFDPGSTDPVGVETNTEGGVNADGGADADADAEVDGGHVVGGSARDTGRSLPSRRRLTVVAAIAVAVLVLGLVAVTRTGSADLADGPRLPEAIDERWAVSTGERFVLDAAITDRALVTVTGRVAPGGVEITAHDLDDGAVLWNEGVDSVRTTLTVVERDGRGDLVVVSATREFAEGRFSYAVEPDTGRRVWERSGDNIVLSGDGMGRLALVDSGRFPSTEPTLELVDLTTGETVPPVGGRLVGLGVDGDLLVIDDVGAVRLLDVSGYDPTDSTAGSPAPVVSTEVATTSPDRRNVVELAGRYFSGSDDGVLVEIGFRADAARVLLDRRPEDARGSRLPVITSSSFLMQIDDRHGVVLGPDGAMGLELVGDELRATWAVESVLELPRPIDGGRWAIDAVVDAGARGVEDTSDVRSALLDAVTGDPIVEYDLLPSFGLDAPADGTLVWRDANGVVGGDPANFVGTAVAISLDGTTRWTIDDVAAGPYVGDRTAVVFQRKDRDGRLVFLDEGPRARN
ncbi:MAG: hypothetical protein AAFP84_00060 [Actinomycetota bacterium]